MSLKKKLSFYFLTLVLILIALEFSMRLIGSIYLGLRYNIFDLQPVKGEFRILCIGESTTAFGLENSYPAILERRLNKLSSTKFKVINAGSPAQTSVRILEDLPRQIETYSPHLVISMSGINDHEIPGQIKPKWYENLRTYKLVKIIGIRLHLLSRGTPLEIVDRLWNGPSKAYQDYEPIFKQNLKNPQIPLERAISQILKQKASFNGYDFQRFIALVTEARADSLKNSSPALEKLKLLYKKSIESDPSNTTFYISYIGFLTNEYSSQVPQDELFSEVRELSEIVLKLDPKHALAHHYLALSYSHFKNHSKANEYFAISTEYNPYDYHFWYIYIEHLIHKENFNKALEVAQNASEKNPFNYRLKAVHKLIHDKVKENAKYINLSDLPQSFSPNPNPYQIPQTEKNINQIIQLLLEKRTLVAIMQYPTRDIEQLNEILSPYKTQALISIENKDNFLQAINEKGFESVFWDQFAGDFGHATDYGQNLIVDNIVHNLQQKWCPQIKEFCFP